MTHREKLIEDTRKALRNRGWVVSVDPEGDCDLLAVRRGEILLIECRANNDPFNQQKFGHEHRFYLSAAARRAGGKAILRNRPLNRRAKNYPEVTWPKGPQYSNGGRR